MTDSNKPTPLGGSPQSWFEEDMTGLTGPRKVFAPWTHDEVKSLNEYQQSGHFHPFTCNCSAALKATVNGWVCQRCSYTQNWAWPEMVDRTWASWPKLHPPTGQLPPDNAGAAREMGLEMTEEGIRNYLDNKRRNGRSHTNGAAIARDNLTLRQRVGELEGLNAESDLSLNGWSERYHALAHAIDPSGRTTDVRQLVERVEAARFNIEHALAIHRGSKYLDIHSMMVCLTKARAALVGAKK